LSEINEATFIADIYLRLSKQDGDNEESDSIGNQRALILEFLKTQPDIRLHKIKIDDGRSGVDFCSPAFIETIINICLKFKGELKSGKHIHNLSGATHNNEKQSY
jgi:hypothetical protein